MPFGSSKLSLLRFCEMIRIVGCRCGMRWYMTWLQRRADPPQTLPWSGVRAGQFWKDTINSISVSVVCAFAHLGVPTEQSLMGYVCGTHEVGFYCLCLLHDTFAHLRCMLPQLQFGLLLICFLFLCLCFFALYHTACGSKFSCASLYQGGTCRLSTLGS